MRLKRIKNFIVQNLMLPISFFINIFAFAPLGFFLADEKMPAGNYLLYIPIFLVIGFGVNKLFMKIKGKQTEYSYLQEVIWVRTTVTEYYDHYEIESTATPDTEIRTANTGYGILAILLSFIAFPMRLIALIASWVALFVPVIFSTYKQLPNYECISTGNRILHTLFDFVIIPLPKHEKATWNILGFIFIPIYLILGLIAGVLALFCCAYCINSFPQFIIIILLPIIFFCIASEIFMIIKHCIIAGLNFSVGKSIVNLLKILAFPLVLILITLLLTCLPYESWGFRI